MIKTFLLASVSLFAASDDVPSWLRDAAAAKVPEYGPKVNAVVLLDEERTAVDESGRRNTTRRVAVKILTKSGAAYASGGESYNSDSAKIRDFRAWMLYPSGKVKKYGKEDFLDTAIPGAGELYGQHRTRSVNAKPDADPGNIFGFEAISEDKTIFAQQSFYFQSPIPAVVSRYSLALPVGWTVKSNVFNHPGDLKPTEQGGVFTWELQNLPEFEGEEASPSLRAVIPRVALSYFPPAGAAPSIRPLANWAEVARWMAELQDPKAEPNAAIEAKAKDLTRNAKTEFEKIQAIGRFVQDTSYVLISLGTGRGGGYTPHAAADIFAKNYGDCKDKSTLMRAMLKSVGIEAVGVGIYSGDRTAVDPAWASPHQFNHAITAIKVSKETQAPAVLEDPNLGRLMLFDPTDDIVPVGYLPSHEQASYALIEDAKAGKLVLTPAQPPKSADVQLKGEVSLNAEGGLSGTLVETRRGNAMARPRTLQRNLSKEDLGKSIERWLATSILGVRVKKFDVVDSGAEYKTTVEFETDRYAQIPNQKMQILKAALFRHREAVRLSEKTRKLPIVLDTDAFEEEIKILLPQGFKVDEIPDAVTLKSEYGAYQAKWNSEIGSVTFTRKLEVPAKTVPAAEYTKVKKFFDTVYGSGNQPVVLMR